VHFNLSLIKMASHRFVPCIFSAQLFRCHRRRRELQITTN